MKTFRLPHLRDVEGLACLFVGRGAEPRPDPSSLVPLLAGENRSRMPVATLRQIHSNVCLVVGEEHVGKGGVVGEGDALMTSSRGIALGIATADCLPLVAVDPVAGALAVVHAGWRGTLAGVLSRTLRLMREELGARAERMLVGAGPAVGACCYRVGPEVVAGFRGKYPDQISRLMIHREGGATHLDLLEANRLQALDAGLETGRFASVGICTVCRPDLCHSYRREGASAGRMWLLAALVS